MRQPNVPINASHQLLCLKARTKARVSGVVLVEAREVQRAVRHHEEHRNDGGNRVEVAKQDGGLADQAVSTVARLARRQRHCHGRGIGVN